MKSKEEKLTLLSAMVINMAIANEVFSNHLRKSAGMIVDALERDARVLEQISTEEYGSRPIAKGLIGEEKEFPNVIYLLADAKDNLDCISDEVIRASECIVEESVLKLSKVLGQNNSANMPMIEYPVLECSNSYKLFQRFENGKSYVPRFFHQHVGRHGEVNFRIMRSIKTDAWVGATLYGLISLEDILGLYGVTNPKEYTNDDTSYCDRLTKAWVEVFEKKFKDWPTGVKNAFLEDILIAGEFEIRDLLKDVLVNTQCDEVYKAVASYYKRKADAAASSKKEVEPVASGSSSLLDCEDVQAVLCTLEVTEGHADPIPAMNRPRYIGWFKTIKDAVDFVTYELENSPMYKQVESVEKIILKNGDVQVTINSVVKLVYHFEIIQK